MPASTCGGRKNQRSHLCFVAEERLESFDGIKWREGFARKVLLKRRTLAQRRKAAKRYRVTKGFLCAFAPLRLYARKMFARRSWMRFEYFSGKARQERQESAKSFDDFHFEVQFLATKDGRQIELPKFSREAQGRPALIQID